MNLSGRRFNCGAEGCGAGPFTVDEVARHVLDCPFNKADLFVEFAIRACEREILEDAGHNVVPRTVASFSELHDYVDANTYGGLCDDDKFEKVCDLEEATGRNIVNEIQNAVDAWIKTGAVAA